MDVDADGTDREFHYKKNPRKIYVSGSFPANPNAPKLRYVSQVTDHDGGLAFATVDGDLVLSRTPTGRFEIRATVVEDDRRIRSVLLQRWDTAHGPSKHDHFTLGEAAIGRLIHFFKTIKTMPLKGEGKIHLTTDEIKDIALDLPQAKRLFVDNEELFLNVAQNSEELKRDLLALGYRRKTLRTFERMMTDVARTERGHVLFREKVRVPRRLADRRCFLIGMSSRAGAGRALCLAFAISKGRSRHAP